MSWLLIVVLWAAGSLAPQPTVRLYLPWLMQGLPAACPTSSTARFAAVPVLPPPSDRLAADHADLNLALRGYRSTAAPLTLVDYGGAADPNAPRLTGLFGDGRTAVFVATYQVHDWDWGCGSAGCRGPAITWPPVTLLGLRTTPGEALSIPTRRHEIYAGGYQALVLYAEPRRITLKYTREDHVIGGYTVHLEGLCVDANLLALYRQLDAAGRGSLPALRNGEALGMAAGGELDVAVRDCGSFMDPRSRKDWWQTNP